MRLLRCAPVDQRVQEAASPGPVDLPGRHQVLPGVEGRRPDVLVHLRVTPPVGVNLFVVHGVRGRGQLHDVMIGAAPFVVTLMAMIVLLIVFPELALWIPNALAR